MTIERMGMSSKERHKQTAYVEMWRSHEQDNTTGRQRYWKIQHDVEGVTEVGGLKVGRSKGDEYGGDTRSESTTSPRLLPLPSFQTSTT